MTSGDLLAFAALGIIQFDDDFFAMVGGVIAIGALLGAIWLVITKVPSIIDQMTGGNG